ncbi:MAG: ATP-binding cassette domain-containing protein, partial [Chloroflexota bacterium]
HFGGVVVFSEVSFQAAPGQITALIGPNGAGKSTLVNIVCGVLTQDAGSVVKDGRNMRGLKPSKAVAAGLARTFQDVRIFPTLTLLENVMVAFPRQPGDRIFNVLGTGWKAAERRNEQRAMELLDGLGLASNAKVEAEQTPFGDQKLAGLARAVVTGADTLLLDEPASGVETARLPLLMDTLRGLRDEGRTVVLIDHNVEVVAAVADVVVVLQGTVIASGATKSVLQDERVIKEYLGRIYDA